MPLADRLEVINAGRLSTALTVEKLCVPHQSLPGNALLAEDDVLGAVHREDGWTSRRDRSLPRQQAMPLSSLGRKTCSPTTASATFDGVAVAKDYERLHQLETP